MLVGRCSSRTCRLILTPLKIEMLTSRSRTSAALSGGETRVTEDVRMRGQASGLAELVEEAKLAEKVGDKRRAIKGYESALRLVAEPLNNLAFLYHDAGRDNEALPLAQLATQFAPTETEFADTLNKVTEGWQEVANSPTMRLKILLILSVFTGLFPGASALGQAPSFLKELRDCCGRELLYEFIMASTKLRRYRC